MASRGKGSKAKGANFELKTSKLFTSWWTAGGFEGKFYRTPASGGLRQDNREGTVGDLVTPEGFTYTIECKNQEQWKFRELFKAVEIVKPKHSARNIAGFWYQACDDARRAGLNPILVFSKNHFPNMVMLPANSHVGVLFSQQFAKNGVLKEFIVPTELRAFVPDKVWIVELSMLLSTVEPHQFRSF